MQTLQQRYPDLSVIVPVYNLEQHIGNLLGTLKAQILDGVEVEHIFVLNNCTDRSEDVIRSSGLEHTLIMNCEEQGCGPARNAGFEASNGEYVWFMDGDDWLINRRALQFATRAAQKYRLNILRVPFRSDKFQYDYFSMVWQYVLYRDFVKDDRFPSIQPCEDDAYMDAILRRVGADRYSYLNLPHLSTPLYYYNYLREGSNMYRHFRGERI